LFYKEQPTWANHIDHIDHIDHIFQIFQIFHILHIVWHDITTNVQQRTIG
jgi:hypothetical protein